MPTLYHSTDVLHHPHAGMQYIRADTVFNVTLTSQGDFDHHSVCCWAGLGESDAACNSTLVKDGQYAQLGVALGQGQQPHQPHAGSPPEEGACPHGALQEGGEET